MSTGTILVQNTVKGFTLLELLIVVAISGILLGVGVPAMGALIAVSYTHLTLPTILRV